MKGFTAWNLSQIFQVSYWVGYKASILNCVQIATQLLHPVNLEKTVLSPVLVAFHVFISLLIPVFPLYYIC